MRIRLKAREKMAMALLIALFLLLQGATGSSALAASQTATDEPISGKATTTVPAGKVVPGQTTTTAPLPSTAPAREYQQVEKPPAKKVDIPEYDLAGKFSDLRIKRRKCSGCWTKLFFSIALKNNGTRKIYPNTAIPIRIRFINRTTDTLIRDYRVQIKNRNYELRSQNWVVMNEEQSIFFHRGKPPAPETISELKLIVDIDPDNTYHEAQRHRGNNRCVATW